MLFLSVPIAALALVPRNETHLNCTDHEGTLITLPKWLLGYGIASFLALLWAIIVGCALRKKDNIHNVIALAVAPPLIFHVIWCVMGFIATYRDSSTCAFDDPELWKGSQAIVILEAIGVVFATGILIFAYHLSFRIQEKYPG